MKFIFLAINWWFCIFSHILAQIFVTDRNYFRNLPKKQVSAKRECRRCSRLGVWVYEILVSNILYIFVHITHSPSTGLRLNSKFACAFLFMPPTEISIECWNLRLIYDSYIQIYKIYLKSKFHILILQPRAPPALSLCRNLFLR